MHATIPTRPATSTNQRAWRQPTEPDQSDQLLSDHEHVTYAHGGSTVNGCARCVRILFTLAHPERQPLELRPDPAPWR